jgi:hypothetical protein
MVSFNVYSSGKVKIVRYIVFDQKGIIHESNSYDDAQQEYEETKEFEGDLIFAEEVARRH